MNIYLIGILAYVLVQLGVGFWVSRRIKNEGDYLLAGRSLGYGLVTFSMFATWFGAETCIGAAGMIYEEGLAGGTAEPFAYGLCLVFMGLFFAVPLWRRRLTTLADFFQQRYSGGVEKVVVFIMAPASILWAAAQVRAFGQVLDATTGFGVVSSISIGAAVAIVYTVLGGLRADVITDLIQGLVLIVGLLVLGILLVGSLGGFSGAWEAIEPERLNLFAVPENGVLGLLEAWAVPLCGSVVTQEIVMRVLAARSPEVARRSALLGGSLYLLMGMIPVFVGLAGFKLIPGLDNPEQILPLTAQQLLPLGLYLIFSGALISAILSTVDSTLLAASSVIAHNLVIPLKKEVNEKTKVTIARGGVIACGVAAWVLALSAESIFELVHTASEFGSAGFFIVVVLGLFTRWGDARAAMATLITGMAVWLGAAFIWEYQYSYLLSLAVSLVVYLGVALAQGLERRSPGSRIHPQ